MAACLEEQSMTMRSFPTVAIAAFLAVTVCVAPGPVASAQEPSRPSEALGAGPWTLTSSDYRLKVTKLADLSRPWGMVFLPNHDILITERGGRLRIVRNGVLDPQPIMGGPTVYRSSYDGLLDIALHPRFADNHLVYMNYSKAGDDRAAAIALFRGRLEGMALVDGRDLFVSNTPTPRSQQQGTTGRIAFGRDGMVYMGVGAPYSDRLQTQNPASHRGKILRLRDDGTVPPDNPFIGKSLYGVRYMPEIYTIGHRNTLGLTVHPMTGELWEHENGPQGGDEINILRAGANYGWPFVSLGIDYDGTPFPPSMDGIEAPVFHWSPSVAPSGLTFYTGDLFPKWKQSAFAGTLRGKRIDRLVFNDRWQVIRVEPLLTQVAQRIRDVREGPDGRLYVLTDEDKGALLVLEPIPPAASGDTAPR